MTVTLKRSMKRLAEAAKEGGWEITHSTTRPAGDVRLDLTLPPDDTIPAPPESDYRTRRFLSVARVSITGSGDSGAWFGAEAHDADGNAVGMLYLATVTDVAELLLFRKRYVDGLAAAVARAAADRAEAERRREIREAYVEGITSDWRHSYLREIALSTPEPPEPDERLNWMRRTVEAYYVDVLAKRMAEIALGTVGWPSHDTDVPIPLSAAIARGVSDVMGNESGSGLDSALVEAARRVLRHA